MTHRRRIIICIGVVIVLITMLTRCELPDQLGPEYYQCTPAFTDTEVPPAQAAKYHAFINSFVERGLPGGAVLIRDNLNRVWISAFGKADIANNIPFENCTRSRVSSVTKIFMATTILSMEEKEVLSINDPVNKYVSHDIIRRIANADQATIRQLLNHTSGIFDYTLSQRLSTTYLNHPDKHATTRELIEFAYDEEAYFPVGTDYQYSNTNYLLLGLIMEAVLHKDPSVVVRERVISKLNLAHTSFDMSSIPKGTARGYIDLRGDGQLFEGTHYEIMHYTPDAALVSNVYDMSVFIESLFGGRLITQTSLAKMTQGESADFGLRTGLGLTIWDTPYGTGYGHGGQQLGYQAKLFYFPERKTTVAIVVNGSGATLTDLVSEMTEELPEVLFEY